jgi:hypothetical protein
MGLWFLVPAFLIGLAALALPILAHLRQRETRDPVRFPSLMFLSRVSHRTTERRRLTYRLLLLMRALAFLALVLAFARPFLARDPDRLGRGRRRALIVLLDRSMSMAYTRVWQRALDSARAGLAGLGPGDRAALIAFDENATVAAPLTDDPVALAGRLGTLTPGARSTALAPAFRLAREVASGARDEAVELLLISDLQRHALRGLEAVDPVPGATLRIARVAADQPANVRVASVTVDRSVERGQTMLRVAARLASEGSGDSRRVRGVLTVNDRELGSATAALPPSGIANLVFDPVRIPDAAAIASVRLDPDDLAGDDVHRFALGGPAGLRVILLAPSGAASGAVLYLERALGLSRSPAFAIDVRRGSIPAGELERAVAVVATDLGALLARPGGVPEFVERGAGLLVFAGGRGGGGDGARPWLPARVGPVVDRVRDRGGVIGWINRDHAAFEPFKDAIAADFGSARYYRYRDLTADSAAAALARFDDGRPALLERRHGRGRVVLVASPADGSWNDLPLQPVFLPLIHRLVTHVANVGDDRRAFEVGEVATLPDREVALAVRAPDGETRRFPADTGARTIALDQPGYYEVTRGDSDAGPIATLAVNAPAAESDLTAAAGEDVAALLRPGRDSALVADEFAQLSPTELESRQGWWAWLLVAALLLLAGEAWYAARLAGRAGPRGGAA